MNTKFFPGKPLGSLARLAGVGSAVLLGICAAQADVVVETIGGGPTGSNSKSYGNANGNTYSASQFNGPSGIALDSAGNLFLADKTNNSIRKITLAGNTNTSITTTYISLPTSSRPVGVALDSSNNLYVLTQVEGRLRRYNSANTSNSIIASNFVGATALTLDSSNNVFVAQSNGVIFQVSSTNGISFVKTQLLVATNNPVFGQPSGLAILPNGKLLVSDSSSNALFQFDPATGTNIIFSGGNGAGYTDGVKSLAQFTRPQGVAVAPNGSVIVADRGNNRVRVVSPTGTASTLYGIPSSGWTANYFPGWVDGGTNVAASREPVGVAISPSGTIFVTEAYYHLLRDVVGANVSTNGDTGANPNLPKIMTEPMNKTVSAGSSVQFTVEATGPDLTYQWYKDNSLLEHATTNFLAIGGVKSSHAGIYYVIVTNPYGTTTSTNAQLTVVNGPVYSTNTMVFGYASGEMSSDFIGSAGQHFYAPVASELIVGQPIYSFQFNLSTSNNAPTPPLIDLPIFVSRILKPLEGVAGVYTPIEPNLFNSFPRLMTIGWYERAGQTNLYNTLAQALDSFSLAHNHLYTPQDSIVLWGAYGLHIPTTATAGNIYEINIGRPSGTVDGLETPLSIQTPHNGSLGSGAVNSTKQVVINNSGSRKYIVGDTLPFRWVNAGEFGDGSVLNADVIQIFQSAVYSLNTPFGDSDFFNAMDASPGLSTNLLSADDGAIDTLAMGDGAIDVDDVYVIYRRSLDPTLKWFARYWSNGVLNSVEVPNVYPDLGKSASANKPSNITDANTGEPPFVKLMVNDVVAGTNRTITIPIRAEIKGSMAIRIAMMGLTVKALDNSPSVRSVQFNSLLGYPAFSDSRGSNNFAGAWLNRGAVGIYHTNNFGTLTVTLASDAPADAAYSVEFDHASTSPNGLGIFPQTLQKGLLTVSDRSGSSWGDGIPDSWRLKNFGSVNSNLLAAATADADGDGMNNDQEYRAGTDPNDAKSRLAFNANEFKKMSNGLKLSWPTVAAKTYLIESAFSLTSTNWTLISSNIPGTGENVEFTDTNLNGALKFYRVRLAE